jgi:apolipoprotein N-acyltransferase
MKTSQKENLESAGTDPHAGLQITPSRLPSFLRTFFKPEKIRVFLIATAGGFIGSLAYEPVNAFFLTPLSVLVLFLLIQHAPSPRAAAARGFIFGWFLFYGALFWLNSLHQFNPAAPLGIVLLAGYGGLYPMLAGWLTRKFSKPDSRALNWILFICLWLLTEWFRTLGQLAFPLVQLGHSWTCWPELIQHASILGELGISLQILLISWLLECGVSCFRKEKQRTRELGITAVICVTALGSSFINYRNIEMQNIQNSAEDVFRIVMFQPNIDQVTKLGSYSYYDPVAGPEASVRIQVMLTEKITSHQENMILEAGLQGCDLVILPETSFTHLDFFTNEVLKERIGVMARSLGAPMIVGGARDLSTRETSHIYNSLYLVHEDGRFDEKVYDKMRLVPFGEHIPYFELIPGVSQLVAIGSFREGQQLVIHRKGDMQFGGLICFESTFSSLARKLIMAGAGFIVVITNDAWYGMTAGAAHHHNLSILRAIENRRYVARCANTGISSIIAPSGRITATRQLGEQGMVEGEVRTSLAGSMTLFTRMGNTWMIFPAFVVLWTIFRRGGGG